MLFFYSFCKINSHQSFAQPCDPSQIRTPVKVKNGGWSVRWWQSGWCFWPLTVFAETPGHYKRALSGKFIMLINRAFEFSSNFAGKRRIRSLILCIAILYSNIDFPITWFRFVVFSQPLKIKYRCWEIVTLPKPANFQYLFSDGISQIEL